MAIMALRLSGELVSWVVAVNKSSSGRDIMLIRLALQNVRIFFVGTLLVAFTLSTLVAHTRKLTRSTLGIDDTSERCSSQNIPSLWRIYKGFPNYNGDLVADEFGVYAAFAANSYGETSDQLFNLKPVWFGWRERPLLLNDSGGFHATVFHIEQEKALLVMVVFRGTDGPLAINDHVSNLTWFTQFLNPWDQYRTARKEFQRVRKDAYQLAKGRPVSFLAVGHSLGGGLARHMAAAFPCTNAIVFNSSFVSNNFRLKLPYNGTVVDVFEDLDPLSKISLYVKPNEFFKVKAEHQWYRTTAVSGSDGQHAIDKLANAMAGMALNCKLDKYCEILRPINKVSVLFCDARNRTKSIPICIHASQIKPTS